MDGEVEGATSLLLYRHWSISQSIGAVRRLRRLSPGTGGQCYRICQYARFMVMFLK